MTEPTRSLAELVVQCLEAEGVEYVFGIPGEENIRLVAAIERSSIRFVLTRHEQGASFMADIYGRLTGKAGVCAATLGPGAINLLLGTADAQTDSTPLVALSAQVGRNRIYKESHQIVDLASMFAPVTKWSTVMVTAEAAPETVRRAFDLAQAERPGAVFIGIPEDLEHEPLPRDIGPLPPRPVGAPAPDPNQVALAADLIRSARHPIILAGHGAARAGATAELTRLSETIGVPVATTFMGKGAISDRHPNALGAVGFMRHDHENFAFDKADVIVTVGYELQEMAPARINPDGKAKFVHIHRFAEDMDAAYPMAACIEADIRSSLTALAEQFDAKPCPEYDVAPKIRALHAAELKGNETDPAFPMKPQRVVADIRRALDDGDIALADTGAIKMWMARLYPTYEPLTCLISNGLATMSFALPGALGAKLARPDRKVLAVMGDGSFLMNSQEIETALREKIPFVALVWVDGSYGLIKWKMDLELGNHSNVDFGNPDFVAYAESFGAKGYRIEAADDLLPTLQKALADDTVSIIACPVDYAENLKLTDRLGELTDPL